jgi:PST family polysaccharide transporter
MNKSDSIQSKKYSEIKNLAALASIQGGNALIPLIMFPFLLSKIGIEKFAKLATFESVAFIILTISLFSFDIFGVKLINKVKSKGKYAIARVYYSILYARIILFVISASITEILVLLLDRQEVFASLVWLLFPFGIILQSSYYYQAVGNSIPLAIFVLVARSIACGAMVLFVNGSTSLISASAFIALSYLASGMASIIYLKKNLHFISPFKIKRYTIAMLHHGVKLFAGGISVLMYRGSNVLLLVALNASPIATSIYSIAEKYIKMIQALTLPATQIYSLRLVQALVSRRRKKKLVFHILWVNTKPQIVISSFLAIIILFVGATASNYIKWIISEQTMLLIAIMLPGTIFGIVNHTYGTIAYSLLNFDALYAKILFVSGVVFIMIATLSIKLFEDVGAAYAFAFSEIMLAFIFVYFLKIKMSK